jgi:hypothetical protein
MGRQTTLILCVLAMVAVVVSVDFLFLKDRFWWRLIANVGIVLAFGVFYLWFLKPSPPSP